MLAFPTLPALSIPGFSSLSNLPTTAMTTTGGGGGTVGIMNPLVNPLMNPRMDSKKSVLVPEDDKKHVSTPEKSREMEFCFVHHGMPIADLKRDGPNKLTRHSWYGKTAHVRLPSKQIVRCIIKEFLFLPDFMGLHVSYVEHGIPKGRRVSPLFLLHIHMSWWEEQVMSDREVDQPTPVLAPMTERLPFLRLHVSERDKLQGKQLETLVWTIEQCDDVMEMLTTFIAPDPTAETTGTTRSA